jgi:3',5'-cyclic AMP phosphodiesterase CpdA
MAEDKPVSDETRQVTIVHLSDLHFGERDHQFNTPHDVNGEPVAGARYPSLLDHLENLLRLPDDRLVLGCITGDLTTFSIESEFGEAADFVRGFGRRILHDDSLTRVCLVPGNHDLQYDLPTLDERWRNYLKFYRDLFPRKTFKTADDLFQLHRYPGTIVLALNSAKYVEKGKPEQDRGNLDADHLKAIKGMLDKVPKAEFESSIRVALMHHHPILIPALAETGRRYDAIHNSGLLLTLLRKYGFHLILHGHKHNPHTFSDDMRAGFAGSNRRPILVVAGGSAGSKDLPPEIRNTFNLINVKWHPAASQARILVETYVLVVRDQDGPLPPSDWSWQLLDEDDRSYYGGARLPQTRASAVPFVQHSPFEQTRSHEVDRLRGNMPVVEVLPSLEPPQAYEARVWIVGEGTRELPVRVTWSVGPPAFTQDLIVASSTDSNFCAAFAYWEPILIQARIEFADGNIALTHIYARVPETYTTM